MELRHLRYFVAVAEELNFTRAAERLRTAQPSLSQQIRDLEQELGVELLTRTKRHVALTPAGAVFLDEARLVLAQAERACQMARAAARPAGGALRIGMVPAAEIKIFPRMMSLMRSQYPHVELTFHSLTTPEMEAALLAGTIDIAFLRPPVGNARLASETVLEEELVVLMPADHPLTALKTVTPEALASAAYVEVNPHHGGAALLEAKQQWLRRHGVSIRPVQEVMNVLSLLSVVSMGAGVTLMADYVSQLAFRNLATRPLEGEPIRVALAMAWRADDDAPAGVAFRDLVRQVTGASGARAPG